MFFFFFKYQLTSIFIALKNILHSMLALRHVIIHNPNWSFHSTLSGSKDQTKPIDTYQHEVPTSWYYKTFYDFTSTFLPIWYPHKSNGCFT